MYGLRVEEEIICGRQRKGWKTMIEDIGMNPAEAEGMQDEGSCILRDASGRWKEMKP